MFSYCQFFLYIFFYAFYHFQTISRPFLDHFQTISRPFLDCFNTIFQTISRPFLDHFQTIFRPFPDHFQTVLRPFPDHFTTKRPFQDSFPTIFFSLYFFSFRLEQNITSIILFNFFSNAYTHKEYVFKMCLDYPICLRTKNMKKKNMKKIYIHQFIFDHFPAIFRPFLDHFQTVSYITFFGGYTS